MKILTLLLLVLLAGCVKYEETEIKTEPAVVLDTYFCASHVDVNVVPGTDGSIDIQTDHVDADFAVAFQCQHGRFVIKGSGPDKADLWKRMDKGYKVNVFYRERWLVDSKGKRTFDDFVFVNASRDTEKE